MAQMRLTPFEDVLDEFYGTVGTPNRDKFEEEVKEAVRTYQLGEAIKEARQKQNLTQEELGNRIGVKKSQISRLERGYSISLPTLRRVFQALGASSASLDLGAGFDKIPLW